MVAHAMMLLTGNILKHDDMYFMYGEHYGNSTGFDTNTAPTLIVYTSPDMLAWVGRRLGNSYS